MSSGLYEIPNLEKQPVDYTSLGSSAPRSTRRFGH